MSDSAAKNIVSLYQRHAAAYAEKRSRSLFEKPWLDKFLRQVGAGGHILDIGCGNGQPVAEYFIHQGYRLTGVDGAMAMRDRARQRFPRQRWLHQDMRSLNLEETFDGLIAWDSFFHLTREDQRSMFEVFSRHAHAGSALMFTSGPADGIAMGIFEGEALYHASLAPDEFRALLHRHGFQVTEVIFNDPDCGGHSVWLCKKIAHHDGDPLA